MDINSIIIILSLGILILMSAYFSATETAFSTFNSIRLKNLAKTGNKKAHLVLLLYNDYDKLLSTILIGNNIVNIGSASLATIIFTKYFGEVGISISTAVMTVLVLIFGEISPKSLAKENPESFAMFSAPILKLFIFALTPLNYAFTLWKKFLSKLFKSTEKKGITGEELLTIVDEAKNGGGIEEKERELIRSAIEFNDLDVEDILTPRVDIVAIEKHTSIKKISEIFHKERFSRLPVYENNIDNIIGVIHEKDFYSLSYYKKDSIDEIICSTLYITKTTKISTLLTKLQHSKLHMAIVVDEFGGTQGIVTLEDILEELVGEIWDEHDDIVENYHKISEKEYIINCNSNMNDIFKILGIDESSEYSNVNTWIIHQVSKLPQENDTFIYKNLKFTITKVSSKRILEVKIEINI